MTGVAGRRPVRGLIGLAAVALTIAAAACTDNDRPPPRVIRGNRELGKQAMVKYGCGSCHTIPGVRGADALVGPPLIHFARRTFIAGQLGNTPENLARWIQDPQEVEPGTAMPDLNVSPQEARNIAAYLLALQ